MVNVVPNSGDKKAKTGERAGSIATILGASVMGVVGVFGLPSDANAQGLKKPCIRSEAPNGMRDSSSLQRAYDMRYKACINNNGGQIGILARDYGITLYPDGRIATQLGLVNHGEPNFSSYYLRGVLNDFEYHENERIMTFRYGINEFVSFTFPFGTVVAQSY